MIKIYCEEPKEIVYPFKKLVKDFRLAGSFIDSKQSVA